MSMFNRFLGSIGLGTAQIDTLLERGRYAPGEEARGIVKLRGGHVPHYVECLELVLITNYARQLDGRSERSYCELERYIVYESFSLGTNETKDVPFSIVLPNRVPLTIDNTPVWLMIDMGIERTCAIEPNDHDRIEIIPTVEQSIVIDGVNRLGFRLRAADCIHAPRIGGRFPFVQQFEFVPTSYFRGEIEEMELIFLAAEHQTELLVFLNGRARNVRGMLVDASTTVDHFLRFPLTNNEWRKMGAEGFAGELAEMIRQHL
ncbi:MULTISPECIES: sporulation protein [Paenibacillus]|uniref:sporulation protein n=1 Tax=Paenibacillus TaxID=44249 RepID=UPI0022801E3F|nr:sporulation protein [Paenibacillus alvei]MCY7485000.1 sporulation protein [Paenibacillus alvei]